MRFIELIEKNPNKPWNWMAISQNPNITIDDISKYPDKPWCWRGISKNKYNFSSKYDIIRYYRKRKSSSVGKNRLIEEDLMKYVWHPNNMHRWSNYIPDQ